MNGDKVVMRTRDDWGPIEIPIPIDKGGTNLPIVWNSFVSQKVKKKISHKFRSALIATRINAALDYFAETITQSLSMPFRMQGIFTNFSGVGGPVNENLTMAQKELLLWHWRLGVGMQRIQAMMRNRTYEDPLGRHTVLPPIIKARFASTSSCTIPKCQSCELAWARQRSPYVNMFRRISMLRELSVVISWKLVILCPRISSFAEPLAGFQVDMVGLAVVSMVELSTMTLHLGSFGLRIKYLLAPVRLLWVNSVLNSGCTTLLAPR